LTPEKEAQKQQPAEHNQTAQSKPGTPEASSTGAGEQRKLLQPIGGLP